VLAIRAVVKHYPVVGVGIAQRPQIPTLKRLHPVGGGLGHVAGGVDRVVQDHQRSTSARRWVGGNLNAAQQSERSRRAQRRGRTHRTDKDDRLVRLQRQGQEIGGFLEGIGAVGDDHAVEAIVQEVVHHAEYIQPVAGGERVARQAAERRLFYVGKPSELRNT